MNTSLMPPLAHRTGVTPVPDVSVEAAMPSATVDPAVMASAVASCFRRVRDRKDDCANCQNQRSDFPT